MIIVIIAGGSGTRLWPLSQANYPKHLLRLTSKTSLLQNTYKRAQTITDDIYVVTEISHAREVRNQLPKMTEQQLIVEPGRRGTASCITLALAILADAHSPDEEVVFLHADHHIVDAKGFAATVEAAAQTSRQHQKITLIGLTPSYPATGFGYIQTGHEVTKIAQLPVLEVKKFVEKPSPKLAEQYVATGQYLWNLGLFAAPINVFTDNFQRFAPDLDQAFRNLSANINKGPVLAKQYLALKSQPIDTALIEKTDQTLVIPGQFDWADIGSFFDLHKILAGSDSNAVKGEVHQIECEDSMIHGSTKPIIAVGLQGIVVVDTPDGLLVCAKEKSQLVGDAVKQMQAKSKGRTDR